MHLKSVTPQRLDIVGKRKWQTIEVGGAEWEIMVSSYGTHTYIFTHTRGESNFLITGAEGENRSSCKKDTLWEPSVKET